MFSFRARAAFLGLVILALGWGAWLSADTRSYQLHPAAMSCGTCHLAGSAVTADNASTLVASQEALCGRCHPKAIQVSHPTGFAPNGKLPAAFPLDWKGDLTCSTCHDVHGNTPGRIRGTKRGRDLCLTCHAQKFFDAMRDQGSSMLLSGHLNTGIDLRTADLDVYTLQCMGCHGTYSDANGTRIDKNLVLRHSNNTVNHPIGRRYAESISFGGFRPEQVVSRKLLLPEGKLSCVSCHQGYTKDHGKLVMPNVGSSLCFECHDL